MEIIQDLSDYVFGIGNWIFGKYYLWVIVEGIIVPKYNGFKTNGNGLRRGFSNNFYQGILIDITEFKFLVCNNISKNSENSNNVS